MFTKLSKEKNMLRNVELDNLFIAEYMPYAPENFVKVYIAGLSMAYSTDNSLERLETMLGIDGSVIMDAFFYWRDQGIINVVNNDPPEIEFLEVKPLSAQVKKFNKAKYEEFNNQLHAMLPNRSFLPSEYNEYYCAMEVLHIDVDAMLAIIAYCVRLKGESIGYQYILTVARNLAHQGATNFERVSEKLNELSLYEHELKAIFKAMGSKKTPDHNDSRLYIKWTKTLGFTPEVIIQVAKDLKKGGMERLDGRLTKYFENHVFSLDEIAAYNQNRDRLYALTKEILRILGIYLEQLDYTIETYINKWCAYGFDDDTLVLIAKYCYEHDMRKLSLMDDTVKKFYQKGLISSSEIYSFMHEAVSIDEKIKSVLEKAGVSRNVTSWDRSFYHDWTNSWNMPQDVIEYAASLAIGKGNAVTYINTILGSWHKKGITSVEAAKVCPFEGRTENNNNVVTVKSADELNALFGHLDPEEI